MLTGLGIRYNPSENSPYEHAPFTKVTLVPRKCGADFDELDHKESVFTAFYDHFSLDVININLPEVLTTTPD